MLIPDKLNILRFICGDNFFGFIWLKYAMCDCFQIKKSKWCKQCHAYFHINNAHFYHIGKCLSFIQCNLCVIPSWIQTNVYQCLFFQFCLTFVDVLISSSVAIIANLTHWQKPREYYLDHKVALVSNQKKGLKYHSF